MNEKRCPHCGSASLRTIQRYDNSAFVSCNRCDARGAWQDTDKKAMVAFCCPRCLTEEYEAKLLEAGHDLQVLNDLLNSAQRDIVRRDTQIQLLRTAYQNGGGALLDAAFAALERWLEDQ